MLEAIRKRAASVVVKILFVLLTLSFVIWGIADVFRPRSGGTDWAAEVGGSKIAMADFQQEYRATLRRLSQSFGQTLTAEQARAMGLPGSILNQMVEGKLFDLAAEDMGLVVSDERIRSAAMAQPEFRGADGKFSSAVFREILRRNGLTEDRYVALMRQDLLRQTLLASLVGGTVAPRALVEAMARYHDERRDVEYVRVSDDKVSGVPQPDDAALHKFYEDHPELFSSPELRAASVVVLSADALAKGIEISDSALQQAYQDRLNEFTKPEQRSFRQIIIPEESTAKIAAERAKAGEDLAAIAASLGGVDAPTTITGASRAQLPEELAAIVFATPKGSRSDAVKTSLGWHVVEVTDVVAGSVQPFDAIKDKLLADLRHEQAADRLIDVGNKLDDALGRGATLSEAASELGLPVRAIESIDARGLDAEGKPVADLPAKLVETIFSTPEGSESGVVEADETTYFVVQVNTVTPAAQRPFAAVRDQVVQEWLADARQKRAQTIADGIADRVRAGATLDAAAAEQGLKAVVTPPFTRTGEGAENVPPAVLTNAFDGKPGEVSVNRDATGVVVSRVRTVIPPDADAIQKSAAAMQRDAADRLRVDLLTQYAAALRSRFPVKVNPQALEQVS